MRKEQELLISNGEPSLGSIYGREEKEAVNRVLHDSIKPDVGFHAEKEVSNLESEFAKLCNTKYAVALNGAGSALDLVIKSLEAKESDEIISCSINFPGTHLSIIGGGAKLILAEPDPKTINLDPKDLANRLTKNTKAIVVTYMNGLAADMDSIEKVVETSNLYGTDKPKIIVDAARSIGTTFKDKHIGSEAWATVFSLQSKKVITALGEGGIVVTDDEKLTKLLREYRSFGKNEGWGSNFKMTKIQAAVGSVQLGKLGKFVNMRRTLADQRNVRLSKIQEIFIQGDTNYSKNSYYLYTVILPENDLGQKRNQLMKLLKDDYGIGTVVGNLPTYKSNHLINERTKNQILPISEDLGNRIVCVCIHPSITKSTNKYIIDAFLKTYGEIF